MSKYIYSKQNHNLFLCSCHPLALFCVSKITKQDYLKDILSFRSEEV